MAKKEVSVSEYAKLANYNRSGVLRALSEDRNLPGIIKSRRIGTVWVLTIDPEQVKIKPGKK